MAVDYRLRRKKIIKWYEYVMQYPQDEAIPEEVVNEIKNDLSDVMESTVSEEPGINLSSDEAIMNKYSDEEVDLSTTGLSEDDQALVADIMARFAEAKQNSVDDLFSTANQKAKEDELISSICAPKQDNVDDLIKLARE